jgi:hypothetical protein
MKKTTSILSARNFFTAAFGVAVISGPAAAVEISSELRSAALQAMPTEAANRTAMEHCGCDNQKGIEMYVQNLINDAQKRGLSCQAAMHVPACITSYCSICRGHDGLVENCIKAGVEYFTKSAEFCSGQQPGVAQNMPDMQFLSQFLKF